MMAFLLGLAVMSCKQGSKAADIEAAADDPAKTISELVEKSKADGANWSVDEWKNAYKTAMAAVAPTFKEISTILEQFKPKEGEELDTTKMATAMEKMKALEERFAPVQELLNLSDDGVFLARADNDIRRHFAVLKLRSTPHRNDDCIRVVLGHSP